MVAQVVNVAWIKGDGAARRHICTQFWGQMNYLC
jgi:hypothetical protein